MTLLGIDYGLKRVGVAVSDDGENFAFPLCVIKNSQNQNNLDNSTLVEEIVKICQEKAITQVIIGESKDFKGVDNTIMPKVREFQASLVSLKPDLNIRFEPEWMTTQQAERFQGKREDIDASAAAVILQSYIDRKNNK